MEPRTPTGRRVCRPGRDKDMTAKFFHHNRRRYGGPESRCKEVEIMSVKLIIGFVVGWCLMELVRRWREF